jgi:hypothetical protein
MDATLLNLPWQVQLSLASGYAAYLVANTGIRETSSIPERNSGVWGL